MGWPENFSRAEGHVRKTGASLRCALHSYHNPLFTGCSPDLTLSSCGVRQHCQSGAESTAVFPNKPRPHNCHNCVLGGLHSPLNKKQLLLLQKIDIVLEACEETWQKHCLLHSSYPKFFKNRLLIQPWFFV